MSLFLATVAASPELVINIGLLAGVLSTVWLFLQIVRAFFPKNTWATKEEVEELRREVKSATSSIQNAVNDLHRAIGRLEGKANV